MEELADAGALLAQAERATRSDAADVEVCSGGLRADRRAGRPIREPFGACQYDLEGFDGAQLLSVDRCDRRQRSFVYSGRIHMYGSGKVILA